MNSSDYGVVTGGSTPQSPAQKAGLDFYAPFSDALIDGACGTPESPVDPFNSRCHAAKVTRTRLRRVWQEELQPDVECRTRMRLIHCSFACIRAIGGGRSASVGEPVDAADAPEIIVVRINLKSSNRTSKSKTPICWLAAIGVSMLVTSCGLDGHVESFSGDRATDVVGRSEAADADAPFVYFGADFRFRPQQAPTGLPMEPAVQAY